MCRGPNNCFFFLKCPSASLYGGAVIMHGISAKDHGGPKCPSVVPFEILHSEGPFGVANWALRFGMTLQYGGHDCFHSEVPFGGWCIPFEMHRICAGLGVLHDRFGNHCSKTSCWSHKLGMSVSIFCIYFQIIQYTGVVWIVGQIYTTIVYIVLQFYSDVTTLWSTSKDVRSAVHP